MDDLQPGRELDAVIARQVMGFSTVRIASDDDWRRYKMPTDDSFRHGDLIVGDGVGGTEGFIRHVPHYSTDIAAAWEVIEWLNGDDNPEMHTMFDECLKRQLIPLWGLNGVTAAYRICLAAIKIFGVRKDTGL